MARVLAVTERRVEAPTRAAYLAEVAVRQDKAASDGAHFWVFEHAVESGRFIEFTEGSTDASVRAVAGPYATDGAPLALWREVQGG